MCAFDDAGMAAATRRIQPSDEPLRMSPRIGRQRPGQGRSSLLAFAVALIAAGCGATRPVEAPEVDVAVPATWASAPADTGGAITIADRWWDTFADPALDRFIDEALTSNHGLRAVAARLDAAGARVRIAGAPQLPALDAGLSATRRKQNFVGFPVPGGEAQVLSTTTTSFNLSASAAWEVDLWGRIRAGKIAALADAEAASADLTAARLALAGQTARAWFGLTEAHLQLRLAEETAASFRRNEAWVRDRFERGLRTSLDLRLAIANRAAGDANVHLRRQLFEEAARRFEILLGRYPAAEIEVLDELLAVPPPVPAGMPADLVFRRPDLVAAERRVVAADARVAEAWRAQFPRLSLTGSAGTLSAEIGDLLDDDFSIWSIAGNLVAPLFQGGRLRAGVKLSEAQLLETAERYADLLLRAYAEVENALAAEELLAGRERQLAVAAEQSVAAQRLAEDRYQAGLEPYLTVLEAQRRALLAQSEHLVIQRQRLDNRVDLFMALGGGFELGDDGRVAAPSVGTSGAAGRTGAMDGARTDRRTTTTNPTHAEVLP